MSLHGLLYFCLSMIFTCVALLVIGLLVFSCDNYPYDVKVSHTTEHGWQLDTREVVVSGDWVRDLDSRMESINDCIVNVETPPLPNNKLILKFVEQECFSRIHPDEEYLCLDGYQPYCDAKAKAEGKFEEWKNEPCWYRTTIQKNWQVIVPMVSNKTTVAQLNLWDVLRAHTGDYWWKKKSADCVGGCR